jgi:hypothetical protein
MNEKKSKHKWGRYFVILPRSTDAERLSGERAGLIKNRMHTKTGRKNND